MKKVISNLLLTVLISLINVSCHTQPSNINSISQTTPPQVAMEIKRKWEEQTTLLDRDKLLKDYPGKKLELLVHLLEEAPSTQVSSELERVRKLPNPFEQMDEYDKYLLQAFFVIYGKQNDRDKLVDLLSAKCPRFIATSAIELEVASLNVKDPFLVLLDSYDKAQDPGARKYLIEIVREALKDLSEKYADDPEFAKMARAWYVDHQSSINTNPYYHPFGHFPEQRDLFVPSH